MPGADYGSGSARDGSGSARDWAAKGPMLLVSDNFNPFLRVHKLKVPHGELQFVHTSDRREFRENSSKQSCGNGDNSA